MTSRLNPYLSFDGNAREVMEFYKDVFGGTLAIMKFGDMPGSDPSYAEKVMHGQLETVSGYTLMAADMPPGETLKPGNNLAVSISGDESDELQLRGYWDKLSEGGTVLVPMEKQMWGDEFGMCVDRFGVSWLVDIGQGMG